MMSWVIYNAYKWKSYKCNIHLVVWTEFFPPKIHAEAQILNVTVFGDRAFGSELKLNEVIRDPHLRGLVPL